MLTKSMVISLVVAGFCVSLPLGISQERTSGERLHKDVYLQRNPLWLSANAVERDAPTLKYQLSVVHLKGDVEIKMLFKPVRGAADSRLYVTLHADEADFNEQTGELQLRGNTRANVEPVK